MTKRTAFVDPRINNYQSLIAGLPSDTQIFVLDSDEDGLEQILAALLGSNTSNTIDIFSHGSPGSIKLGTTVLNSDNLAGHTAQLAEIGRHLSRGGDLLFYGCDVAQGASGQAFIQQLALLTGSDVAASSDATGAAALGGNWTLEAATGPVEASVAVPTGFSGLLSSTTIGTALNGLSPIERGSFGEGTVSSFGQTFFAPDAGNTVLQSFSFWIDPNGPGDTILDGYLATWTGQGAGTILWSSAGAIVLPPTAGMTQLTYSGINVNLNFAQQYLFFVTTSNSLNGIPDSAYTACELNSPYPGLFVEANNQTFSELTTTPSQWIVVPPIQSEFLAQFSSVNQAPVRNVPSSIILAGGAPDSAYLVSAAALLQDWSDPDGGTLAIANLSANHGTVADNGDGTYSIRPELGYAGRVNLSYSVIDGQGGAGSATASYLLTSPHVLFTTGSNYTEIQDGAELWVTDGTATGTQMLKDINPGRGTSNVTNLTDLKNGNVVFSAWDGTNGQELWVTDGTLAGTTLLKDIFPGSDSSGPSAFTSIGNGKLMFTANNWYNTKLPYVTDGTSTGTMLLTDLPGILVNSPGFTISPYKALNNNQWLFAAADGYMGELWATDGTPAGTVLLKQLNTLTSVSYQSDFTNFGNGKALFSVQSNNGGGELWVTDGSPTGTMLLKSYPYPAIDITALSNGKVLFLGFDSSNGGEPWITDGTVTGTILLKDIRVGSIGSGPSNFISLGNGQSLFTAANATSGQELWITDGSASGTNLLKDINPGSGGSSYGNFIAIGIGKWVFTASNPINGGELWVTDGTSIGTTLLKDINPGNGNSNASDFILMGNGKVTFLAYDSNNYGLWVTDGTSLGTTLLAYNATNNFTTLGNGKWLFTATDAVNGNEPWITDGTPAGTTLLKDINPGATDSSSSNFTSQGNGKLIFTATDATHGSESWITDGTAAGTTLLKDIVGTAGSNISNLSSIGNGKSLFWADATTPAGSSLKLWITDGTNAGTTLLNTNAGNTLLTDISNSDKSITALGNGKWLFGASNGSNGFEPWITDGTAANTNLLRDIFSGLNGSSPSGFTALGNGKAVFQARNGYGAGTTGAELWVTDGTSAGTILVKDIYAGASDSSPSNFTALGNGKALFSATDSSNGAELWITDGTLASTILVKDIYVGASDSSPSNFTALGNGKALFSATDLVNGRELWVTDGTAAGTALLKNIRADSAGSNPSNFTALGNGKALFSASDWYFSSEEPWITDGTSAGTTLLKDIYSAGVNGSSPSGFIALGNGKALFSATDASSGRELWVTDGTSTGTTLLKDICAGTGSSNPNGFTALGNGKMVFQAFDASNGIELWITDGSAAGTTLLKNIMPAFQSSNPSGISALGNGKALFRGYDTANGYELWITDGTEAGTTLVKDINSYVISSSPTGFTTVNLNATPTAANHVVTVKAGSDYVFTAADFGYSDPDHNPLDHIVIASLPSVGNLYLDINGNHSVDGNEALAVNATLSAAEINLLRFKPVSVATGDSYASFAFKVSDGLANSATANTLTVNVFNEQSVPSITGGVSGDGNGDGIQDNVQSNVESLQSVVQINQNNPVVSWATLVAPTDALINNAHFEAAPPTGLPAAALLPFGVFSFNVNSATVGTSKAMSIYLTGNWQSQANGLWHDLGSDAVINGYWKQSTIGTWHNIANQIALDGGKLRIDFTLKDGNPITDADGIANGVIVDPGAPGYFARADTVITLGDAPLQISRADPNAWSNAWTSVEVNISHKADAGNALESWSSIRLSGLGSSALEGGDLYAGDLGVSGQSLASSAVRQEIDGTEGLRFNLTHLANEASFTLSRLFAQDDAVVGHNEAGRIQAYKGNTLIAEQVFQGDSVDGQKLIVLNVNQGFDSLVLTAGAYEGQNQFVSGAYRDDAGQFASAPYTDSEVHSSDYLVDVLLIGVSSPAV
jgi:ELWxxDGT repeat protein